MYLASKMLNKTQLKAKIGFFPLIILLIISFLGIGTFVYIRRTHLLNTGSANSFPQKISATSPIGIFAVLALKDTNNISFADETYKNPNISGVAPRISWNALEPQENQFKWQILDDIFQKASANNKKIIIIPIAGFDTPQWALQGVQTANFPRKYGKGAGQISSLPIPWDQTYLTRWYTFLGQVANRYGNNSALVMIGVGGPTSVSAEMSLPNTDNDLRTWISLGYTPSKYENAWKQTFTEYARLFPHQHFALALYPGLPINEQGQVDQSASAASRQAIIDLGENMYPNQFALQTSGLNASKAPGGGYDIVLSFNGKIATGFQMSTSASIKPAKMGDSSNPVNALKLSIDKGVTPNQLGQTIKYLEIYEPDINNPDMQSVLAYGQQLLLTGKVVQPTIPLNNEENIRKHDKRKIIDTTQIDEIDPTVNY